MKAEELMIGDWVFCTYPSIKKPFRVEEIRTVGDNELKIIISDEMRLVFQERYIEPISLTPEILEKNGFKKEGSWFIIEDDYYDVSIKEITDSIWRVKYCNTEFSAFDSVLHIAFVHELQHALKLCGIDKEIVI